MCQTIPHDGGGSAHKKTASLGGETAFFYFPFTIFIMAPIVASIKQGTMNFIALVISSMFFLPLFFIYLGQSSPLGSPKM